MIQPTYNCRYTIQWYQNNVEIPEVHCVKNIRIRG